MLPELSLTPAELAELEKKVQELQRAFAEEEAALREIRDFVAPYRGKFSGEKANKGGARRDKHILTHEAILASRILAAGLQSGVTSPARPWFKLATTDPANESEEVGLYLDDTQKRMELVFAMSNFYNSTPALYYELGGLGTGAMLIDDDFETVVRFRTLTAGEYWLGLNDNLKADKLARKLEMTARQLLAAFGEEALPPGKRKEILTNLASEQSKYQVYHLIEPNPKHNPLRYQDRDFAPPSAFRGVYWLKGEKERPLKVVGYHEKPFAAPRWDVVADSVYGRSPAWECLGLIKSTNKIEADFLGGLSKQINPPLLVPSDMRDVNIYPGALNYYTAGSSLDYSARIGSLYDVQPDLNAAMQKIGMNKEDIRRFFYADLFAMLSTYDGPRMTAQEVIERHEEKLLLLGPVLERLYDEFLRVVIERVFGIMARKGLLAEPPEILAGRQVKIEYVSILAQAQKMVRLKNVTDLFSFVGSVAPLDMEGTLLKSLDLRESLKIVADYVGAPAGLLVGDTAYQELVAKEQELKAQQEQWQLAQQLGTLAGGAAETVKTLADSDTAGQNALTSLGGQALPEKGSEEDGG